MKALYTILFTLLLFTGCRSAEDAFNDGRQAEAAGNNQQAVNYYIEAIRLKPEFLESTTRLETVGKKLMTSIILQAKQNLEQRNGVGALAQLKRARSLKRRTSPYTANVNLPSNLETLEKSAQQVVIKKLFNQVFQAERGSQWDQALKLLNDIKQYQPNSDQQRRLFSDQRRILDIAFKEKISIADQQFKNSQWQLALDTLEMAKKYADNLSEDKMLSERHDNFRNGIIIKEATALKTELQSKNWFAAEKRMKKLDTLGSSLDKRQLQAIRVLKEKLYNAWADDLFKQKKYRQSWHRSQEVLKYVAENKQAQDRQLQALKLGTQNFVLLPIIHGPKSNKLCNSIDSSFNNGPARNMPPFTSLVRDFDLREAFRAFKINPQRITRNQAIDVAKRTHANYIIFREITLYRVEGEFTKTTFQNVELAKHQPNKPDSTKLEIKTGLITLKASIRFSVVDHHTGHSILSKEGKIDSSLQFEQAFPDRPLRELVLTDKQRSLLITPGTAQDIQQLEKEASTKATDFFLKTILPELELLVP